MWGAHQCCQTLSLCVTGPKDALHRLHLLVPLGQQDVRLPQRSSPVHLATGSPQHPQLLWICQCQVLPPPKLYHPVLPHRHAGKLTFPLCATCVQEEMDKPPLKRTHLCAHSEHERALSGTWCTPELRKAVELGYQIQYIYEVWHFPETCQGLFQDYVNTWLKIQQEASGWPKWVGDDETKRQHYIRDYYEHEGIHLEYDKIEHNPGLRALAKMMLNSMWGKFGQRFNKTQVKEFDDPKPSTASWIPTP